MITNNYSFLPVFITIGFLLLATKPDVYAQSGFAKAIPVNANVDIDDITFYNEQLILRGNIAIDSIGLWGLYVAGLDTNGLLIWQNTIYDTTLLSHLLVNTPSRVFISSNQQILLPTNYYSTSEFVIYFTDMFGKEIKHRFYPFDGFNIFPFDINEVFEDYYISGIVSAKGFMDIFILKINQNGDQIWLKYFGAPNLFDISIDVDINSENTLSVYGARLNQQFVTSEAKSGWKKPWLFTIDTSGTILSEWFGQENDPRTLGGEYFMRLESGDWIMQGTHYKNVPGPFGEVVKSSPTVTSMDSNFVQKWKIYLSNYEDSYSDRIQDLEYDSLQGHIVVTGGKYIPIGNKFEYVNWTIKMDTSGQILWNNTDSVYYSRQNGHYAAGLAIAPSGSIYVGGYVTVNELEPGSQAFVIKYTSDGCSDTLCTTTSITEQIRNWDNNIVLFPNPANDKIEILIKELSGGGDLKIFDLQGKVVKQSKVQEGKNSIPVHNLPDGLFMFSVFDHSGSVFPGKFVIRR